MTQLLCGVIGHPVGHSLSPLFQNAALAATGRYGTYAAWDVTAPDLPDFVRRVRDNPQSLALTDADVQMLGFNATLPHKEALVALLDWCDPLAAAIGAVNTVVVAPKTALSDYAAPRLLGYNTDAPGLRRAVLGALQQAGIAPQTIERVLMLGASGAARGAAYGLLADPLTLGLPPDSLNIRNLSIANRSHDKAEALAAHLRADPLTTRTISAINDLSAIPPCDLLVNATSLGVRGEAVADEALVCAALGAMRAGAVVYDLVYRRDTLTPFLVAAAQVRPDLWRHDGLTMLVWQGALAFERWMGETAPLAVMAGAVGLPPQTLAG